MACLIEYYTDNGGRALYLCTNNPFAGTLYEKHGFRYYIGDGMRYLAPDSADFDAHYFRGGKAVNIRPAVYGDLPRFAALYNHPEPDWLVKNYLVECYRDTRFEVHFLRLMQRIKDDNGFFLTMKTEDKHLVGAVAGERLGTYYEQHIAHFTVRISPGYYDRINKLLCAAENAAREIGIECLYLHTSDRDSDQIAMMQASGFEETGRYLGHFKDEEETFDLVIMGKNIPGSNFNRRSKGDYYGGENAWQAERKARQ